MAEERRKVLRARKRSRKKIKRDEMKARRETGSSSAYKRGKEKRKRAG